MNWSGDGRGDRLVGDWRRFVWGLPEMAGNGGVNGKLALDDLHVWGQRVGR